MADLVLPKDVLCQLIYLGVHIFHTIRNFTREKIEETTANGNRTPHADSGRTAS